MKIILFHLIHSRSQRILWLLEELGLNYDLKIHHQHVSQHENAEIKKFNPDVKFPTLVFYDELQHSPIVLTESSAIIEYCSHITGRLGIEKLNAQELIDYYF